MPGLKHIQLITTLVFDDGHVVNLATPVFTKDIRNGDFFDDDMTEQVITGAGQALAEMIKENTLSKIYGTVVENANDRNGKRRPKPNDPFSIN